jgi:hypothetical protein
MSEAVSHGEECFPEGEKYHFGFFEPGRTALSTLMAGDDLPVLHIRWLADQRAPLSLHFRIPLTIFTGKKTYFRRFFA